HEPVVPVEHGGADVDEEVHAVRMRDHPALAVRAVELPVRAVQAPDHRLALRERKTLARHRHRQGERAGGKLLAAGAVARQREQWRRADAEAHLAAQAAALPRQFPIAHDLCSKALCHSGARQRREPGISQRQTIAISIDMAMNNPTEGVSTGLTATANHRLFEISARWKIA